MDDNILILGGLGFIGKNLIKQFQQHNVDKIVVVSRTDQNINKDQNKENIIIELANFDNLAQIIAIIKCHKITIVIHLISGLIPSSGSLMFKDELQRTILPTYELIDYLATNNITLLFFSSGGAVYGDVQNSINENTSLNPINYYGFSKMLIEQYITFTAKNSALKYLILRPSNVYGEHQNLNKNQGFIGVAVQKVISGQQVEIWGDGSVIRDYVNVEDVANITVLLLKNKILNTTLNLSTGKGLSLLEILKIIEQKTTKLPQILFRDCRKVDASTIVLSNDKLLQHLSYHFKPVATGIAEYVEYYKNEQGE